MKLAPLFALSRASAARLPAIFALAAVLLAPLFFADAHANHYGPDRKGATAPINLRVYSGVSAVAASWVVQHGHDGDYLGGGYEIEAPKLRVNYSGCSDTNSGSAYNRCYLGTDGNAVGKAAHESVWTQWDGKSHWVMGTDQTNYASGPHFKNGYTLNVAVGVASVGTYPPLFQEYIEYFSPTLQVVIGSPITPRNLRVTHNHDHVSISWEPGVYPDWLEAKTRGANPEFTKPTPNGFAYRWLRNGTTEGWATAVTGGVTAPVEQGYVYVGADALSARFPALPGEFYNVQVAAHVAAPGKSVEAHHLSAFSATATASPQPAFTLFTGEGAQRVEQTVTPAFEAQPTPSSGRGGIHRHSVGPIPHAHDTAAIRIKNAAVSGAYKAVLLGQTWTQCATPDAAFCDWEIPLQDAASQPVWLAIGENQNRAPAYEFRVHRLADGDKAPPPANFRVTASEYAENGAARPQILLEWEAYAFAEGYTLTCQDVTDADNPVQLCTDSAYAALNPEAAEDGVIRHELRDVVDFGKTIRVNVAANLHNAAGVFASGEARLRDIGTRASLSALNLEVRTPESYALEPAGFHPERFAYTLRLAYPVTLVAGAAGDGEIGILPVEEFHARAAVDGVDAANAAAGGSDVTVTVTAEDGNAVNTYTIHVIRYPNLHTLNFAYAHSDEVVEVTPDFRAHARENRYALEVPFAAESGTLQFFRSDSAADFITLQNAAGDALTATADSSAGGESRARFEVPIALGGENYTLTAAQTDGGFAATYHFHITRPFAPSDDSNLHQWVIRETVSGELLTIVWPPDAPDDNTVDVETSVAQLDFALQIHEGARATVNAARADGDRYTFFNGATGNTHTVTFAPGRSIVEIVVTAENGSTSTYLVRVWYPPQPAQIPDARTVTLTPGDLTPQFDKALYAYTATMPAGTTLATLAVSGGGGVTFEARTTKTEFAAVSGSAEIAVQPGANFIWLRTSENGFDASYVVRAEVTPAAQSDDNRIHAIFARHLTREIAFTQLGGANAGADFDGAHLQHTAEVVRTAQSVHFTIVTHAAATFTIDGEAAVSGVEQEIALAGTGKAQFVDVVVTAQNGVAKNYIFEISPSSEDSAPLPPSRLTLTPQASELRAVWLPPANDGGHAVTTYFLRWKEDAPGTAWVAPPGADGMAVTPADDGGATTYVVTPLPPGVTYSVQVAAANTIGVSAWARNAGAADGALPPPLLTLRAGNQKITASWETPADAGGNAISGLSYRIRHAEVTPQSAVAWANAAGEAVADSGGGSHSYEITGLQNAAAHAVQVASVSAHGRGVWSASEIATPAVQALRAPQNLAAESGDRRIALRWEAPAVSVSEYRIRWARVFASSARAWNDRDGVSAAAESGGGAYVVRALPPGVTYELQVAAVSSSTGRGDWAAALAAARVFSLDINADGAITAADGILVARYLLGVEGDSLFAGQTDANLSAAEKQAIVANLEVGKTGGHLNVDAGAQTTPDAADGFYIARYLLGLRGDSLHDEPAKRAAIMEKLNALSSVQ